MMLLCLGFGVWWMIERHSGYAWILQDILGAAFCIQMMKKIRLSSLKVCTVLLALLFVYDIFFVFITPLFTKSGRSIMIDVATGGSSTTGEMLPMVFVIPRMDRSDSSLCGRPYSLLGFGDVLVPGLLVSFCHGFDLQVRSHRVYYVATCCAYAIGLIVTFVAMALMRQGQPALLYLVPCTLLTVLVVGALRHELKQLWTGKPYLARSEPFLQDADENLSSEDDEREIFLSKR
jgi:signal peptide peptidase-like protein 2B